MTTTSSIESDPNARSTTKLLKYNPLWIDSVFTTRSKVEQLLAPERESGNICHYDYEAAMAFLPNYHRHLAIVGFILGSAAPFAIRHPKIIARRPLLVAALGPLGFAIGGGLRMVSHARFLSSIQDPEGFQRAMDNIEKIHPPRSEAIMGRAYTPSLDDPHPTSNQGIILPSVNEVQTPTSQVAEQPTKPPTKWEELRQANSKPAPTSSWDNLRQKYEKQQAGPQWSTTSQEGSDNFAMKDSGDKYN